jgi:hypothetical protein
MIAPLQEERPTPPAVAPRTLVEARRAVAELFFPTAVETSSDSGRRVPRLRAWLLVGWVVACCLASLAWLGGWWKLPIY